jgi:hypothetical protein
VAQRFTSARSHPCAAWALLRSCQNCRTLILEWQGDYTFAEPVRLEPGDRLLVECVFDNSETNQRMVNGELEAPRDLNWGEDQEMCVGYVTASLLR